MTAEEVGLCIAYENTQPFGSPAIEQAVALVLAAIHNGPQERKDKRAWRAADFMVADPWAPPPSAATLRKRKRGPTLEQLKARFAQKQRKA